MKKINSVTCLLGVILCMVLSFEVKAYANSGDPLCFMAAEGNVKIKLNKEGSPNEVSLETSSDNTNWTDYAFGDEITLESSGSKVYFRNKSEDVTGFSNSYSDFYRFSISGNVNSFGDVTTLLRKSGNVLDISEYESCFFNLFDGCVKLLTPPELPSTKLSNSCYRFMFNKCNALKIAPVLPATTMTERCYDSMFAECKSLVTAPKLPATTLDQFCYNNMFYECTSLLKAPELPATELAYKCYANMFSRCTALTYVEVPFTDWRDDLSATSGWFYQVDNVGTIVCPSELEDKRGQNYVPTSWEMRKGYILTFDSNGYGYAPRREFLVPWETAEYPGALVYEGKYCTEWYEEAECINKWDFDVDTITENKTLYAKWVGTEPVYITKTKKVEKIVNPETIKARDNDGNIIELTLGSDGIYYFSNDSKLQDENKKQDKEELLSDLPSKGIKLVIGLDECGIDGKIEKIDASPEVIDGVTFLPIRLIAEYLGATVSWDETKPDEVVISKGDETIILTIGSNTVLLNDEEYQLDYAPYIKNDRTYLPLRFISEHLGAKVEWNENDPMTVKIYER